MAAAVALENRGEDALREMPSRLQTLPSMQVPLRPFNIVGLPALRALLDDRASDAIARAEPAFAMPLPPPLRSLIDDISEPGRGLVMVMGKGGVGKTTIAASIAAELASRGHAVHLSTTDPAALLVQARPITTPGRGWYISHRTSEPTSRLS